MNIVETENEARKLIIIEDGIGDKIPDDNGNLVFVPDWEIWTPIGWCFEPGRHVSVCFSLKQAKEEKKGESIEKCQSDCECLEDKEQ